MTRNAKYSDNEVIRTDNFINPYMSKVYGRENIGLLSIGIVGLFSGRYNLEDDPEYANLILDILASM